MLLRERFKVILKEYGVNLADMDDILDELVAEVMRTLVKEGLPAHRQTLEGLR